MSDCTGTLNDRPLCNILLRSGVFSAAELWMPLKSKWKKDKEKWGRGRKATVGVSDPDRLFLIHPTPHRGSPILLHTIVCVLDLYTRITMGPALFTLQPEGSALLYIVWLYGSELKTGESCIDATLVCSVCQSPFKKKILLAAFPGSSPVSRHELWGVSTCPVAIGEANEWYEGVAGAVPPSPPPRLA